MIKIKNTALKNFIRNLFVDSWLVFVIASSWIIVYNLNIIFFLDLYYKEWAAWVYLPAALRIICVLIFERVGALGLFLGSVFALHQTSQMGLPQEIMRAATSGLAPLLAVWLCRRLFSIAPDLRGLRPLHILVLSIMGAAINASLINAVVALSGHPQFEFLSIVVVFLGDLTGTAIVLFVISTALALLMPRLPGIGGRRSD